MNYSAWAVIILWVLGTVAQFATSGLLIRRGLGKAWSLAIAGLVLNAAKSAVLMAIWGSWGFRAYSNAWMATRWVHWVAILLLLLQALWALSRVWPQGKPFAVLAGGAIAAFAALAASLQSNWIIWPGSVGSAVVVCRSFSIAAVIFVFWIGWVYRGLRVVTANAALWRGGIQAALCIEIICLAVEAATQRGPGMVAAQLAKQTAYMAACCWWWRMGSAGEAYVAPKASDLPERAWRVIEAYIEGEKRRMAV